MCYVKVDHDMALQRKIRLSSIAPIAPKETNGNKKKEEEEDLENDELLNQLLEELGRIRLAADNMERKITDIQDNIEQDRMLDEFLTGRARRKAKYHAGK